MEGRRPKRRCGFLFFCLMMTGVQVYAIHHDDWTVHDFTGADAMPHVYHTNTWYKYASLVANSHNRTNCYVCSYMPVSVSQPTLTARPFTKKRTECIIIQLTNHTVSKDAGLQLSFYERNVTCLNPAKMKVGKAFPTHTPCASYPPYVHLKVSPEVTPHVRLAPRATFPICYAQKGSTPVGGFKKSQCVRTYVQTPRVGFQSMISFDKTFLISLGYCSGFEGQWCPWIPPSSCTYVSRYWMPRATDMPVLDGVYWMCGSRLYLRLPPSWDGVCAPTQVTDHTFIVSADTKHLGSNPRRTRAAVSVEPHDAIWGTDVPEDKKLWTTGDKVLHALFPWVGVGKHALMIETIQYRLTLFMNATTTITTAQGNEISEIRTMVLQNRLVLDLLAASKGGVCALINDTCCTFISDSLHTSDITDAIHTLNSVASAMQQDTIDQSQPWWSWITAGPWWHILLKALSPLFYILVVVLVLTGCIIPCIRAMVTRMVTRNFLACSTYYSRQQDRRRATYNGPAGLD